MSFKRYHIPNHFWEPLENAPDIMPSKYMGGITFHRNAILLHKDFNQFSERNQLRILAHEGYHVAQQNAWGWFSFMWKYIREWVKCGFKYENMKKIGNEKAAYDYEKWFQLYTSDQQDDTPLTI